MFTTLLIANRGEIARRVAATAHRMGVRTVAVYSDADAQARHVAACDTAVHIGGSEPRASYLRVDAILDAARQTGAQAIHPGYGFLSENEGFARACADAGLIFVGPPAAAIAAMGSKSAAKTLMAKAGVPLVPGYHGDNQDPDFLQSEADAMGYPVLIKASLGGGGKGMRIVEDSAAFAEALSSCKREAASSFGDDKVLIERYLQKPRHIEIQVFADSHGHCVYLFERDCSVQRRHQKVIEEAPAPGMSEERRSAMGQAAVAAARAVNYVGAGTVEFIVEPSGHFYFMEMNTRLQVEHPVTEMITGLDLVEWQLRVAAGEPLPMTQEELRLTGHAIEARIYAESPEKGFLPSIGTLSALNFPPHVTFENGDVRIDGGVRAGDTISPFYDPMIAKLIVRGADRDQARARMIQTLGEIQCVGVGTNIAFLRRLMSDPAFAAADLDTGLIERQHDSLFPTAENAPDSTLALAAAALLADQGMNTSISRAGVAQADPFAQTDGWRIAGLYKRPLTLIDNGQSREIQISRDGQHWFCRCDGDSRAQAFQWQADSLAPRQYRLRIGLDGRDTTGVVILRGDLAHVFVNGGVRVLQTYDMVTHARVQSSAHQGGLTAPMPGKIIAIHVKAGDTVKSGDALLVMEAMKMEHTIHAPGDGTVDELFFAVGDQVTDGVELIAITQA
ncbi:acetyl/propionyl/methylcrotonyl-CoA carboxylase subunit alpha [Paralcaligenes ureilyticus]|uniref:3-methylcrotonoyl-CoA carboxylase alpha subunit /biotin carboxylase /acetyl-CoA carboxylase carboxyltransferase subunit alpha n=1 Tax=Paralcaligenes ureilyticus TaxID=627131 RepID=A0A4R3M3P8_9BURK|nr:acetyl/propionyl/methylcrotonyl-CoA carboxylase subunit alpha [Paralcaligenes ureilyticus]TCT05795.1 3-methylcrotonoyl-CoA carboxylase alpha subunit /biotin carboxylase /acetyl-CoA carboxylase carboxyltransferase subunit alpha [Paralcaligenes ureilyticus]